MKVIVECKNHNHVTSIYGVTSLLNFVIKSLSGAYLSKFRWELNETWYISRWPLEEMQSAGKAAWASVCPAICPFGVIPLIYTVDAEDFIFTILHFTLKITY